jgi:hypothetical protein
VFAIALGKASSEVYNFARLEQSHHNFREFVCTQNTQRSIEI